MQWKNTSTQWGGITQIFHWGMLLLFITQYSLAYTMLELPPSDQKWALFAWHKQLGVTLFLFVFLRFWWRERNPLPRSSLKAPPWDSFLSKIAIWALYVVMFCFPLSGLLLSILGGYPVSYFNLFTIPALMEGSNMYADAFLHIHVWLSFALYALVGLHILGGLYHHFILKDNILLRMLPLSSSYTR